MNPTKDKKEEVNYLDLGITAFYFFIPFYGLRFALEEYLFVDDLSIEYVMLLGLFSSIIMGLMNLLMKKKTIMIKIIGAVALLGAVVVVNQLVT